MENRRLGRSGVSVPPLGMGCWAIGGPFTYENIQAGWGEVDDAESIRALQRALESGITFFDTAAAYGTGHSEQILGRALGSRRSEIVIATKFGFAVDTAARHIAHHADRRRIVTDARADCEASLRRLGTDVIDLLQLHDGSLPLELVPDMLVVLEDLVAAGKIRSYGWSTDSPEGARAFAAGPHCVAIQHDLNVVLDAAAMLTVCEQQGLASVNRTPLARGALTGKYTRDTVFAANDVRNDPWAVDHILRPAFDQLEALRAILTSNGRTLAQGALAWIWARSPVTVPIPGIRTVGQLEENAAALQFGPLTPAQMAEIDHVLGR